MSALASSLIAAAALVLVALLSFFASRKLQAEAAWRNEKLEYYKELMDALAQNIEGDATASSHRELARASNNLLLVAPRSVLQAHHNYREHISRANKKRDYSLDSGLLATLINAMRNDLKMPQGSVSPDLVRLWRSGSSKSAQSEN